MPRPLLPPFHIHPDQLSISGGGEGGGEGEELPPAHPTMRRGNVPVVQIKEVVGTQDQ